MHNMTTGSPLKRIINFSIPLLIGNICPSWDFSFF